MSDQEKTSISGFTVLDPTRESRLQKELEYLALDEKKFESDADFAKWKEVTSRMHTISTRGYVGLDAIGEQLIKEAEEEYKPIRAEREKARLKTENQEAVSKVITKWLEERTPLHLIFSGKHPELCAGAVIKFAGFEAPSPFVLLGGFDFRRKIALSDEWAVSKDGKTISSGVYAITASGIGTNQVEELFLLSVADLQPVEAK